MFCQALVVSNHSLVGHDLEQGTSPSSGEELPATSFLHSQRRESRLEHCFSHLTLKTWATAAEPLMQELCRLHGPVRRPLDCLHVLHSPFLHLPIPKIRTHFHLEDQLGFLRIEWANILSIKYMVHCTFFNSKLYIYHDLQIGDSSIKDNALEYVGLCLISVKKKNLSFAVVIKCIPLICFNRKFKSLFNQNYKS